MSLTAGGNRGWVLHRDCTLSKVHKARVLPFAKFVWEEEHTWQTVAEPAFSGSCIYHVFDEFQNKINVSFGGLILHRGCVGAPASSSVEGLGVQHLQSVRLCSGRGS